MREAASHPIRVLIYFIIRRWNKYLLGFSRQRRAVTRPTSTPGGYAIDWAHPRLGVLHHTTVLGECADTSTGRHHRHWKCLVCSTPTKHPSRTHDVLGTFVQVRRLNFSLHLLEPSEVQDHAGDVEELRSRRRRGTRTRGKRNYVAQFCQVSVNFVMYSAFSAPIGPISR